MTAPQRMPSATSSGVLSRGSSTSTTWRPWTREIVPSAFVTRRDVLESRLAQINEVHKMMHDVEEEPVRDVEPPVEQDLPGALDFDHRHGYEAVGFQAGQHAPVLQRRRPTRSFKSCRTVARFTSTSPRSTSAFVPTFASSSQPRQERGGVKWQTYPKV